jgi:hypothetical protein
VLEGTQSGNAGEGGLLMHYLNVGQPTSNGAFEYMDSPSSPKWDAMVKFAERP